MKLWQKVLCASVLDLALGDPRFIPHPVKLMGRLAVAVESPCRHRVRNQTAAGVLTAAIVVLGSALAASGLERTARRIHPAAGDLVSVALIYTAFAARDLATHAEEVQEALNRQDLPAARAAVARMVGRDTSDLDTAGVVRATVESVAENTVDGVISPLFYALVGGMPSAIAFKAISTLDSVFGYRNARYLRFGRASARLDDVANYLPARLAVPFVALAAALLGHSMRGAVWTACRDAGQHPSPNSGLAEAAVAGALEIRLGGPLQRDGREVFLPYLGRSKKPLEVAHIQDAVALMWLTYALVGVFLFLVRALSGWSRSFRVR